MAKVWIALPLLLAACVDAEPVTAPGEPLPPVVGVLPPDEGRPVLPTGYAAETVTAELVDPRAVAFDDQGAAHVLEGQPARLSRVSDGVLVPVATGGGNGPWTGVARVDGRFYVAEAGGALGGRVLRVEPHGALVPVVSDLPAGGLLGPLVAGPDGALYAGVSTAQAAGGGADIPCQDIRLQDGRRVSGQVPCTGAVLRIQPASGEVEVHSWGYTNPVALAFTPEGRLLVADDVPRQVANLAGPEPGDILWRAEAGVWFGWPDYAGQVASADPHLAVHPNPPPPVATLGGDVRALAIPGHDAFGGPLQAFTAREDGAIAFTTLGSGVTVPFAANLERPTGLAFDPGDGSLWVADAGSGLLWRIVAFPGAESSIQGRNVP
ncbi:MAG: hypothetical protein AB1918_04580 [Pseudomonadota bacterium]